MKRAFPIHPFLFSFFFVAGPLMNFTWDIDSALVIRLLLFALLVTLGVAAIGWWITGNLQHSAFVCTLLWISLGLTSMPMLTNVPEWIIPVRAAWIALLALWALIVLLVVPRRFWRSVKDPSRITVVLNVIGLVSASYFAVVMIHATVRLATWRGEQAEWLKTKVGAQTASIPDPPDIYYIILDGYAREDVLRELYGLDNRAFLDSLGDMGFYVADQTHTNYTQTGLSLASSLNLQYLDEQIRLWGPESADRRLPAEMIQHSLARAFLEARGYRTVDIISGFYSTETPDADERLGLGRPYGINVYEQFWIMYSPLQELIPKDEYGYPTWGYAMHRQRIIRGLDALAEVSAETGPKFVVAHILAAHPPFVFREDGTPVPEYRPYLVSDGDSAYPSRDEYVSGYVGQLAYINRSLLEILPVILRNSERPAVIILQGDHGPRSTKIRSGAEDSCLWERASIFNAYYLPEEYRSALYPSITPVNTFRLVFREIFHADYPPLEDRTFYSTWSAPYRMTDIGDRIAGPCSP